MFHKLRSIFCKKQTKDAIIPQSQKVLTQEFLLSTPKDLRQQEIYGNILDYKIDFNKDIYKQLTSMKKGHQLIWTMWHVQGEVSNGGYSQFFYNHENCEETRKEYYAMIYEHFTMIHCKKMAGDFERAVQTYQNLKSSKNKFEEDQYVQVLADLDNSYYDNEKMLIESIDNYIAENLELFID